MDEQEVRLREQISGLMEGSLSIHAFRDWFREQEWEADPPADWSLIQLILGIDKRLAIFNSSDFTVDQLRASLIRYVKLVDGEESSEEDPLEYSAPMVRSIARIKSRSKPSPQ